MRFALFRFLSIISLSAVVLSGCRSTGSEFLGQWANEANANDSFEIMRNGDEYMIVSHGKKIGATYIDGTLKVNGAFPSTTVTFVQEINTLLGPGMSGGIEYKRQK